MFCSYGFASLPSPMTLDPEKIEFRYMSFDGQITMNCRHDIENDLSHDWYVSCKSDEGYSKVYRVHLKVSKYTRTRLPKNSYEVLYWVTDRTPRVPVGTGTTVWFHFNDNTDLSGISLSQSVDEDTAGLYLTIKN